MEVIGEDFHFNGEDPLKVLKSASRHIVLATPLIGMIWLVVAFYNWAS